MDTQLQNFWIESIDKEASLRFAWHLKYSKQFAKKVVEQRQQGKRAGLVLSNAVTERIKKIESESKPDRPTTVGGKPSSQQPSRSQSTKSDRVTVMRDMRPPSQSTRSMLYSGISAHGEGRYAYLKKRKLLTPEQKYEFPILSSCSYGWKITELTNPKPSHYARTCVIKDSFYRNSGIMFGWVIYNNNISVTLNFMWQLLYYCGEMFCVAIGYLIPMRSYH